MKLHSIAVSMLVLAVPAVAQGTNATLACKLSKLDPASLSNPAAPVTDNSNHPLSISFAPEMDSNPKTGGFRIDLASVAVTDPDNLFLGAKIISAGMTRDRGMLFFTGETKTGDLIQIPVPKSSKEPGIWNAAMSLGRDKNHIFMGRCSLAGLSEAANAPSEPKQ